MVMSGYDMRQVSRTVRGAFDEGQGLGQRQGFERGVLVALGQAKATEDEAKYLRGLHARSDLRPKAKPDHWRNIALGLVSAAVVFAAVVGVTW